MVDFKHCENCKEAAPYGRDYIDDDLYCPACELDYDQLKAQKININTLCEYHTRYFFDTLKKLTSSPTSEYMDRYDDFTTDNFSMYNTKYLRSFWETGGSWIDMEYDGCMICDMFGSFPEYGDNFVENYLKKIKLTSNNYKFLKSQIYYKVCELHREFMVKLLNVTGIIPKSDLNSTDEESEDKKSNNFKPLDDQEYEYYSHKLFNGSIKESLTNSWCMEFQENYEGYFLHALRAENIDSKLIQSMSNSGKEICVTDFVNAEAAWEGMMDSTRNYGLVFQGSCRVFWSGDVYSYSSSQSNELQTSLHTVKKGDNNNFTEGWMVPRDNEFVGVFINPNLSLQMGEDYYLRMLNDLINRNIPILNENQVKAMSKYNHYKAVDSYVYNFIEGKDYLDKYTDDYKITIEDLIAPPELGKDIRLEIESIQYSLNELGGNYFLKSEDYFKELDQMLQIVPNLMMSHAEHLTPYSLSPMFNIVYTLDGLSSLSPFFESWDAYVEDIISAYRYNVENARDSVSTNLNTLIEYQETDSIEDESLQADCEFFVKNLVSLFNILDQMVEFNDLTTLLPLQNKISNYLPMFLPLDANQTTDFIELLKQNTASTS
jgi:hypothetical protein